MEQVDMKDSESFDRNIVWVQIPSSAPWKEGEKNE